MSIDVEYAIKKDIRNNPVVREVDHGQKREFLRTLWLAVVIVGALLFAAWQHFGVVQYGYEIERVRKQLVEEETLNRQLRLEFERGARAAVPREARDAGAAHGAALVERHARDRTGAGHDGRQGDRRRGSVKGTARDRRTPDD